MTEVSENKDQAFRDWKKELDEKCEEYLRKNPEKIPAKGEITVAGVRAAVKTLRGDTVMRRETVSPQEINAKKLPIIRVAEHMDYPGTWIVYVGKAEHCVFWGDDAHKKASKYASDLLNSNALGLDYGDEELGVLFVQEVKPGAGERLDGWAPGGFLGGRLAARCERVADVLPRARGMRCGRRDEGPFWRWDGG